MPLYHVRHETRYHYDCTVSISQQQLHLLPRHTPRQRILSFSLCCSPEPGSEKNGFDFFGNPVHWLSFDAPHAHLSVCSEMTVEVSPNTSERRLDHSLPWEHIRNTLLYNARPMQAGELNALRVLFESPCIHFAPGIREFAADCFPAGAPLLVCVQSLMQKLYEQCEFDPHATTVTTSVSEVLQKRRGVCQDFAHLMLACLRTLGLPARYVSGYLLTHPPEGKPRLAGADASHAWISVYSPTAEGKPEWVDFDPTNNLLPDCEHITLAWGRDFGDVSPLRGIIRGGGTHHPHVEVTVTPRSGLSAGGDTSIRSD